MIIELEEGKLFIGHYSAAFVAKAIEPKIPLWHLFIVVQIVDIAWASFVLLGIEHVRLVPGLMPASMLDLYHMPYSHSLLAAMFWSAAAGVGYMLLRRGDDAFPIALVVFAAAISHWLLDLVVHAPDLPLYPDGPKVGFGLWNSLVWSQVAEIGSLIAGAAFFWMKTYKRSSLRDGAFLLAVLVMIALQIGNALPPDEVPSVGVFAATALAAYGGLALLAFGIDRLREIKVALP